MYLTVGRVKRLSDVLIVIWRGRDEELLRLEGEKTVNGLAMYSTVTVQYSRWI